MQRIHRPAFTSSEAVARIERTSLRPNFPRGDGMISLAMGEPDFDTPPAIVEAAVDALRAGYTRYADPFGDGELRDALAAVVSGIAGTPFTRDQILITQGSTAGLAAAVMAIVNPGDRVVIAEPAYSLYADLVHLAGGIPVFVALGRDYHLDFERLAPALASARLVVLCSPSNPTGAVYRANEWAQLAGLIAGTGTYVLTDEAYSALVYDGARFTSGLASAELRHQLVYAQTFSKAYAMTGWRVGYLAGPPEIIRAAAVVHRTFNATTNAFVQRAALAAVTTAAAFAGPWLAQFTERRALALAGLRAIAGLTVHSPEGGFYIFPRYAAAIVSTDLLARMRAAGVDVRAGREYGPGGERHFRISFATGAEKLALGIARIADVFGELTQTAKA